MSKRFYIIGHNPNTAADAVDVLKRGANAIEPDIRFNHNKNIFIVSEKIPVISDIFPDPVVPKIEDYLSGLSQELAIDPTLNLALIIFDIKDANFDINLLIEIIRNNFTSSHPGIPIILTYGSPDGAHFITRAKNLANSEAVGIDAGTNPEDVYEYFSKHPDIKNYIYSDGISLPGELLVDHPLINLTLKRYLDNIKDAIDIKNQNEDHAFSFIYGWTVNGNDWMRKYLDAGVDGLITDEPEMLRNLLESDEYKDKFVLAERGDNPFQVAEPIL